MDVNIFKNNLITMDFFLKQVYCFHDSEKFQNKGSGCQFSLKSWDSEGIIMPQVNMPFFFYSSINSRITINHLYLFLHCKY